MQSRKSAVLFLILILSGALCSCQKTESHIDGASLHEVTSPAGPDSSVPNLAVGPDGTTYLSWIEVDDKGSPLMKFATKTETGWSEAHTVVKSDDLIVSYADFPSLLALDKNLLAAHWMTVVPDSEGYNVNIALSRDGGQTWTKPVVPHRDGTPTEHGFVSMALQPSGDVAAIWLDSRKFDGKSPSNETAMMVATITPDGVAGPESVLDDRVCECCQTSAIGVPGGMLAVYRDRSKDEIRDIAIVRFDGKQWSAPKLVSQDNWKIDGCPINGPAIAADGANVVVAWFTGAGEKGRVNAAFSTDGGNTFGKPVQIDDGNPVGRVDVVTLESGKAVVSWLERLEMGAEVRAREIQSDGTKQASIKVGLTSAGTFSGFPRMRRSNKTITFAWTDTDKSRVMTATLGLGGGK